MPKMSSPFGLPLIFLWIPIASHKQRSFGQVHEGVPTSNSRCVCVCDIAPIVSLWVITNTFANQVQTPFVGSCDWCDQSASCASCRRTSPQQVRQSDCMLRVSRNVTFEDVLPKWPKPARQAFEGYSNVRESSERVPISELPYHKMGLPRDQASDMFGRLWPADCRL